MPAHYPILLLDDDANLVDILSRAAVSSFPEAEFFAIHSYEQAAAYLDGLQGIGPRLILLDIHLHTPQSGLDFLSRLRQHPQGRLIPAVVVSASLSQSDVERAYQPSCVTAMLMAKFIEKSHSH